MNLTVNECIARGRSNTIFIAQFSKNDIQTKYQRSIFVSSLKMPIYIPHTIQQYFVINLEVQKKPFVGHRKLQWIGIFFGSLDKKWKKVKMYQIRLCWVLKLFMSCSSQLKRWLFINAVVVEFHYIVLQCTDSKYIETFIEDGITTNWQFTFMIKT